MPERSAPQIQIKAEFTCDVLVPPGASVWASVLTNDMETGEPRIRVRINATCDTEEQARDTLRLAAGRIADALDEASR